MLKLLNAAERTTLTAIYREEFDADLPDENQAKILANIENGEITGFITTEVLLRVGMVWVKPELRETTDSATMLKQMIRYLAANIPKGSSVIVISSDEKFNGFCEKSGLREVEGQIYRVDF